MRRRRVLWMSIVGLVAIFAMILFFFSPSALRGAVSQAFRFIGALQEGRIHDAYAMTDRGSDVGRSLSAFAANSDIVFLSARRHQASLASVSPSQSRAQRIVRMIRGVAAAPDPLYLYFEVGVPFLVRMRQSKEGWKVSYFEDTMPNKMSPWSYSSYSHDPDRDSGIGFRSTPPDRAKGYSEPPRFFGDPTAVDSEKLGNMLGLEGL